MLRRSTAAPLGHVYSLYSLKAVALALVCTYVATFALSLPNLPFLHLLVGFAVLLLSLASSNGPTAGVFLGLFGPQVLGVLGQVLHLPIPGSSIAYAGALVLLIPFLRQHRFDFRNSLHVTLVLAPFIGLLCASYFLGPRTEYSAYKLTWSLVKLFTSLVCVFRLFYDRAIRLGDLGFIYILSGATFFIAECALFPDQKPADLFVTAGTYDVAMTFEDRFSTNLVSILCSTGFALVLGGMAVRRVSHVDTLFSLVLLALVVVFLNSCGQRLFLFGLPLIVLIGMLATPRGQSRHVLLLVLILVVVSAVSHFALARGNIRFEESLAAGNPFLDRTGRGDNWIEALRRISEKPFLGHGLGGYFIEGYSLPGGGTFPHNLFLEVFVELGIGGILLLLSAFVHPLLRRGTGLFRSLETGSQGSLVPFYANLFLYCMFSFDLTDSAVLIAAVFVLWFRASGVQVAALPRSPSSPRKPSSLHAPDPPRPVR